MKVTLRRTDANEERTFGLLETESGEPICFTLEHPWRDVNGDGLGDKNVSCIPAGEYPMFYRVSHKYGGTGSRDYNVWELEDVPGRSNIQIHVGNRLADSRGCILVGQKIAESEDAMILGSKPAHDRWVDAMAGNIKARLVVIDAP